MLFTKPRGAPVRGAAAERGVDHRDASYANRAIVLRRRLNGARVAHCVTGPIPHFVRDDNVIRRASNCDPFWSSTTATIIAVPMMIHS